MREERDLHLIALHCTLWSYSYSIYITILRFLNSGGALHTNTLVSFTWMCFPWSCWRNSGFPALDMRGVYESICIYVPTSHESH